jgi:hypothetical protein
MPSNMGRVAGYPLWSAEMIMRLGQLVSDDIATPANQSGLARVCQFQPRSCVRRAADGR